MDRFAWIPSEIRVEIILQLQHKKDITSLIQASPAMRKEYVVSKAYIIQTLVKAELDDELMQDAMGILLFPHRGGNQYEEYKTQCGTHVALYEARKLPNPLEKHDHAAVSKLYMMCHRIKSRMLGYLNPGLDLDPYHYQAWPSRSEPSSRRNKKALRAQNIAVRIGLDDLDSSVRRALFEAFLRYELSAGASFAAPLRQLRRL
ncbi:hypothetical protein FZEAL_5918 [Fusarium zealandicum]|uniref:Uncharacterized protein n=1 Tax=Fusarium zealandicum TaxID=1053134 RepID=A0A8H4XK34_9HYPO|nr:hypothetical protein FZEAL_5918 [Fusarium zealandicum]